jgi:hypothetical protein
MNRVITIQPAPDSALGQLLTKLEAAEATAMKQRLIVSEAREAFAAAELASRRASYMPRHVQPAAEQLDAMHARRLELLEQRNLEEQKLTGLLNTVCELQERWDTDYRAFLRLHSAIADLQRLGGS